MRDFFNNSSYATWGQTALVVLSVFLAYLSLKSTDRNQTVNNSFSIIQEYYTENPSAFSDSMNLRRHLAGIFQPMRDKIPNYSPTKDLDRLSKIVNIMILESYDKDENLKKMIVRVDLVVSPLMTCVEKGVCDKDVAVKLLGKEILSFYNAACPYFYKYGNQHDDGSDIIRYMAFLYEQVNITDKYEYMCQDSYNFYKSDRQRILKSYQ